MEITTVGTGKIALFRGQATSKILCQLSPNYVLIPSESWVNFGQIAATSQVEYTTVITKLRTWGPSLSRHFSNGSQQELTLRKLANFVLVWAEQLRENNCRIALFETAGSHHLDMICFEIACQMANVEQVFLEYSPFADRLIPLKQRNGYESREIIMNSKIDWGFSHELLSAESVRWERRTGFVPNRDSSGFFASYKILQRLLTRVLKKNLNTFMKMFHKSAVKIKIRYPEQLSSYGVIPDLSLILKQRKALKYLKELEIEHNTLGKNLFQNASQRKVILIMAHSQPEVTSFPLGGKFGNHIDLIYTLKQAHPDAILLYREHPHIERRLMRGAPTRVGIARSIEYYDQLLDLGCIFLNRYDHVISTAIRNTSSVTIVTISGKIALERALQGLRTVVVGFPWFRAMPGIESFDELLVSKDPLFASQSIDVESIKTWLAEVHRNATISIGPWTPFKHAEQSEWDPYYSEIDACLQFTLKGINEKIS